MLPRCPSPRPPPPGGSPGGLSRLITLPAPRGGRRRAPVSPVTTVGGKEASETDCSGGHVQLNPKEAKKEGAARHGHVVAGQPAAAAGPQRLQTGARATSCSCNTSGSLARGAATPQALPGPDPDGGTGRGPPPGPTPAAPPSSKGTRGQPPWGTEAGLPERVAKSTRGGGSTVRSRISDT